MMIMMANAKGGVGKTTLAIGIAGEFEARGFKVKMWDGDREQNLIRWYLSSKENDRTPLNIEVHPISGRDLASVLSQKPANEVYILDTPGRDADIIDKAMFYTDCVVSPIRPVQNDLIGSSVVAIVRNETKAEDRPPMLLVISGAKMLDKKSQAYPMMQQLADQTGLPIAETIIKDRNCMAEIYSGYGTIQTYQKLLQKGETVTTGIEGARKEFHDLTNEIIKTVREHAEKNNG